MAYCVVHLYILVTDFLHLQIGEHLTPMSNSKADLLLCYFDINRFGELVPNILDCHVSGIPFQLMC